MTIGCTPPLSQSAVLFQERRIPQDRYTRRLPTIRSNLGRNLVHQIPLKPPKPWPEILHLEKDTTPDTGRTAPWPHGSEEVRVVE